MKTLRNIFLAGLVVVLYSSSIFAQGDIITAAEYMKLVKADKSLITIDASKAGDYKKSHIRNAVNIPNVDLNTNKDDGFLKSNEELATIFGAKGVSADKAIVVYDGGAQKSASRVYWVLKYLGASNVKILHKNMATFKKSRVPLTPMATKAKKATFTVNVNTAIAADLAEVKSGKYKIVDARDANEFAGTTDKSKGHIPSSINIGYKDVVDAKTHVFKSKAALESFVKSKGINPGDAIIVSCQSGKRAAVLYVVFADILGYKDVKMYDGSYNEWVAKGNAIDK
jgi:thiosulfate/3-mercaptopyruvate sulfurtransferase